MNTKMQDNATMTYEKMSAASPAGDYGSPRPPLSTAERALLKTVDHHQAAIYELIEAFGLINRHLHSLLLRIEALEANARKGTMQ